MIDLITGILLQYSSWFPGRGGETHKKQQLTYYYNYNYIFSKLYSEISEFSKFSVYRVLSFFNLIFAISYSEWIFLFKYFPFSFLW